MEISINESCECILFPEPEIPSLSILCCFTVSLAMGGFFMTFSLDAAYELLYPHFQERLHRNEPLANHSPLGIGGQADLWVSLASTQELIQLVQTCAEEHFPLLIVGN